MTRKEQARLREIVGECMRSLQARGRYTTAELYEHAMERFESEIISQAHAKIHGPISRIHREDLRGERTFTGDISRQMSLPNLLKPVHIPASSSVPNRTEDGRDELVWTTFVDATFLELEEQIAMLPRQTAADQTRLEAMLTIHGEIGAEVEDPSERLGDKFRQLFGIEVAA